MSRDEDEVGYYDASIHFGKVRGAWRWAAGLLGILSLAGAVGLAGAALQEKSLAYLGWLLLVLLFGSLLALLAVTGEVRVPLKVKSVQATRSFIATALAWLFYAIAVGTTALLVWHLYVEWNSPAGFRWNLREIAFAICAVLIPWTLWPRREKFKPPGPRLDATTHPDLFKVLEEVAEGTGQRMPDEVYLIPDFNAWVRETEEPGQNRGKRVMGIGLPLFLALPVPALRAILAHEFGHYHGSHERETLRFYKVSRVLTNTVNRVRFFNSLVWLPLYLYYQFFRTVTMAVSRIQEYEADRLAASLEGPTSLGHGLQLLHAMAPMYDGLWSSDIKTLLDAGYRPPILEGFRRVSGTDHFRRVTGEILKESMKQSRASWTDSHPSLPQRLSALGLQPSMSALEPDGTAMSLLGSTEGMEDALLTGRDLSKLKPISWVEAGEVVEVPEVLKLVGKNGKMLRGMTPRNLPTTKRQIKKLTHKTRAGWKGHLDDDHRKHMATLVLGGALILLLREKGWRFDWLPGEPMVCQRDSKRIHPYKVVDDLLDGSLALDEWARTAEGAGIADESLEAVSLRARSTLAKK